MRARSVFFSFAVVAIGVVLTSVRQAESQKGDPPGGFGKGKAKESVMADVNRLFDSLARGRDHFLLSDTKTLREPLAHWAEENGVKDGKITREQFVVFMAAYQAKGAVGGGKESPPPSTSDANLLPPDLVKGAKVRFRLQATSHHPFAVSEMLPVVEKTHGAWILMSGIRNDDGKLDSAWVNFNHVTWYQVAK